MAKVAFLAVYTAVVVGVLEWAVTGSSGNEPRHRIEALVPGGVTTLTVAWALASLWVLVSWFRAPSASLAGDMAVLALYVLLVLYIDQWARRVALPTHGGISPSEVWLYLAGGIRVAYGFGAALTAVVAVGVVRGLRGR